MDQMNYEYVGKQEQIGIALVKQNFTASCWSIRTRAQIYRLWIACVSSATDPQLAKVVPSPAYDAASSVVGTRMKPSQGQGCDRYPCKGKGAECSLSIMNMC